MTDIKKDTIYNNNLKALIVKTTMTIPTAITASIKYIPHINCVKDLLY